MPAPTATWRRDSAAFGIRIHDFDGPEEFLESMRDADITRKHRT